MLRKMKSGFSLMEMMIVLLIISIIAAATAPMITKKMSRGAGSGDSPWVFTGDRNSIGYLSNNGQVLIGASKTPNDAKQSKLYIAGAEDWSHIRFGNSNNSSSLGITANPGTGNNDSAIGISNVNIPNDCIMFGVDQSISGNTGVVGIGNSIGIEGSYATAIGYNAKTKEAATTAIGADSHATAKNTTAVGYGAYSTNESSSAFGYNSTASGEYSNSLGYGSIASGTYSIALGYKTTANREFTTALGQNATASNSNAVAVGSDLDATGANSVAIGYNAQALGSSSVAIGGHAKATYDSSAAIGAWAQANRDHEVTIGYGANTVYIPGNLVVDGNVLLAGNVGSKVYMRSDKNQLTMFGETCKVNGHPDVSKFRARSPVTVGGITRTKECDRRLKNVGEKYIAGIEELKKLDFYHYTYKKDEEKTPHVGVMAQDLQKVFPDAVTKGEDGYLRIRMEDMFYAVINAVKELDLKIVSIVEKVDNLVKDFSEMKALVENQQNEIKDLKAQNKEIIEVNQELIKRIEKLEKKTSKKD